MQIIKKTGFVFSEDLMPHICLAANLFTYLITLFSLRFIHLFYKLMYV